MDYKRMYKELNNVHGRQAPRPNVTGYTGSSFRNLPTFPIADELKNQFRVPGFYEYERIPDEFYPLKDNFTPVGIPGYDTIDNYFEKDNDPEDRMFTPPKKKTHYPISRYMISHQYDDVYSERLAKKKVERTKPLSFLVLGPTLIAPSPLAKRLARKYGSILLEPRTLVADYFCKLHGTKTVEYDINDNDEIISSQCTFVPAKLLKDIVIKKLNSYAVYKRGYVLTGLQYCKYGGDDFLSDIMQLIFTPRFLPDIVVYVEATVEEVQSLYEEYTVYPMTTYELSHNFCRQVNDDIDLFRAIDKKADMRKGNWHKLGKSLSLKECMMWEVLELGDVEAMKKRNKPKHLVPNLPEPVIFSVTRLYAMIPDVKMYYEVALTIENCVRQMDHQFVIKVKATSPSLNQFHVVLARLHCLPIFKIPECHYGHDINEKLKEDELFEKIKPFISQMKNDEIVRVLMARHEKQLTDLDEFDSGNEQDGTDLLGVIKKNQPYFQNFVSESQLSLLGNIYETYPHSLASSKEQYEGSEMSSLREAGKFSVASEMGKEEVAEEEGGFNLLPLEMQYEHIKQLLTLTDQFNFKRIAFVRAGIDANDKFKKREEPLSDEEYALPYGAEHANYKY